MPGVASVSLSAGVVDRRPRCANRAAPRRSPRRPSRSRRDRHSWILHIGVCARSGSKDRSIRSRPESTPTRGEYEGGCGPGPQQGRRPGGRHRPAQRGVPSGSRGRATPAPPERRRRNRRASPGAGTAHPHRAGQAAFGDLVGEHLLSHRGAADVPEHTNVTCGVWSPGRCVPARSKCSDTEHLAQLLDRADAEPPALQSTGRRSRSCP